MGQLTQHFGNLLFAVKIGENTNTECEWYTINFICDATIGVLIQWCFLTLFIYLARGTKWHFTSGDYGSSENYDTNSYLFQLILWVVIVLLAKITNIGCLIILYYPLNNFGKYILRPLHSNPKMKLIFVMIIFPVFFLTLQLWVTDNFIQKPSDKINNQNNQNNNYNDLNEETVKIKDDYKV